MLHLPNRDIDRKRRLKAGMLPFRDDRRFKGKGGGSPPPAPDPVATAQAQAAANKEAAIAQGQLNMVNQYTPYGSLEYTQRGTSDQGTPQYSATQKLSDEQQQLLDLSNQAQIKYGETANDQMDAVRSRLAQPLDYSSLGPAPTLDENTRSQVAASMYERMRPQYEQDEEALRTRLANQGISDPNSQAYRSEMDAFNRRLNDARLAVDANAGNEMRADFGARAGARDRAVNEMIQQRQVPLNELSAMMTGAQVQGPQFVSPPQSQVAPADIMGATYGGYQGQMQGYAAQQQAAAANRQGLYGLLGSGLMAGAYLYCFDADTPVEMADGATKRIADVQVGDETKGGRVYSTSIADGAGEDWYDYAGVIVTGSHSVFEAGRWIRVADSENAEPVPARLFAFCLGTTEHEIHVNGVRFGDADEIDRAAYIPVWDAALSIKNANEAA